MTPRISVIIPAYRCEATAEQSVRSALAQSVTDIEVLVVDDGSDDGTPAVLARLSEADARVRVLTLPENGGVANARNQGALAARAEWLSFLDSDDLWTPDKLEAQLALAERTGADLIYTAASCIGEDGAPTGRAFAVPETVTYRSMLTGNDLICSSVLLKKALFLRHPMERSDLHEDYLCWMAILKDGAKAAGLTEPMVLYRVAKGSKSGNKRRSAAMAWRTYRHMGFGRLRTLRYFLGYCVHGVKRYWL